MYIQEVVPFANFDPDLLDCYRALGVDLIQLDLRAGVSRLAEGEDFKDGQDRSALFSQLREQVEAHGLQLNAVFSSCWEEISLGMPDWEEKTAAWCRLLESLGRAGIPHLGWNFKPMGNFRTLSARGRGKAQYSTFDRAAFDAQRPAPHQPLVSEEEMWARLAQFLKTVLPVAESAGVRMALHPDDPPIPEPLAGVAQICSTLEQFRRIFAAFPSPSNALIFCQGCMTELLGEGVYDAIGEMAGAGRIAWVHFRNLRGRLPRFEEVFIDEGRIDMRRAMAIYRDYGFAGPYMIDHTPHLPKPGNDLAGRAYAIGYIRALIQEIYG
ncbi:MAG: mannonate dehydratase [Candidatus Latescibacteria bacterium]|nr:mannonate dehydratase [Candidatus Latescibacterota bacterium]